MAARLPVVAYRVGGVGEIVVDGQTGFLGDDGDVATLAMRIRRVLEDEDLSRRMGEAGRRRVEGHFTVERQVERTEAVYEEVVARWRGTRQGHGD
jgi:glycosyltransferase involved in cell wall biosynthesis